VFESINITPNTWWLYWDFNSLFGSSITI